MVFFRCFPGRVVAPLLRSASKVPQRAAAESQNIPGEAHGQLEAEHRFSIGNDGKMMGKHGGFNPPQKIVLDLLDIWE